jgi:predicted amidophosphoribosyltransferase
MIEHILQYYERGFSLCNYVSVQHGSDSLSEQIRNLKTFHIGSPTASPLLAFWSKWLVESIALTREEYDIILRVPGHDEITTNEKKALHVIAQTVASQIVASLQPNMLIKKHVTAPQRNNDVLPDVKRRATNITDSFEVNPSYKELQNKNILIIDDVITTGATLKEVGKVLSGTNSTNKLYFFTLASAGKC